jgi:triosephosphate isomerase
MVLVATPSASHVFGETDEQTARKCALALQAGLTRCCASGETLEEREAGLTEQVVVRQLPPASARSSGAGRAHADRLRAGLGDRHRAAPPRPRTRRRFTRDPRGAARARGDKAAVMPILYGGQRQPGNAKLLLAARTWTDCWSAGPVSTPGNWAAIVQD